MRFSRFLLIFAVLGAATLAPRAVCADNQPWVWMLWPNEWQKMNDFKPYLKGETLSQRSLWDDDDWSPEAWIKDAGDARRIMHDLYAVGIVTDQYENRDDIPVLEVGEAYRRLSMLDRNRVLQFVDYVFGITKAEENGMFYIVYEDSDDVIGVYNKYGMQHY